MNLFNTWDKVAESNRIEGITRDPLQAELIEHDRFVGQAALSIPQLEQFVHVYQPDAVLRVVPGLDVRVGNHIPPRGGEHIREQLGALLDDINAEKLSPWEAHVQYETLHPFTDGNGRSGRAVWYWHMTYTRQSLRDLGFLHAFYYQTLSQSR